MDLFCNTAFILISILSNSYRPFAGSRHMVLKTLFWGASYAVGLLKQRKVGLDWYEFLWIGSPTALFASHNNLFHIEWPDCATGLFVWMKLHNIIRHLWQNHITYNSVLLRTAHWANWPSGMTILHHWFDYLEERSFSLKNFVSKHFVMKTSCTLPKS